MPRRQRQCFLEIDINPVWLQHCQIWTLFNALLCGSKRTWKRVDDILIRSKKRLNCLITKNTAAFSKLLDGRSDPFSRGDLVSGVVCGDLVIPFPPPAVLRSNGKKTCDVIFTMFVCHCPFRNFLQICWKLKWNFDELGLMSNVKAKVACRDLLLSKTVNFKRAFRT